MSLQEVAPVAPALRYPNLSHPKWTTDQLEALRQLHEEGFSATLIAQQINETYGTGYSRNAIIGACHRYSLPKRISKVRSGTHAIERRRDGGTGSLRSIVRRAVTGTKAVAPTPVATVPFLGVPFMALERNQCRFPRGENPILFCGQPQREDSSYCPHCHSIAHGRSA